MRSFVPILATGIMVTVLMSGMVNINFQHNLHLPKELTNPTVVIEHTNLWLKKTVTVYLSGTIGKQAMMNELMVAIDKTKKGDQLIFHLSGYGGDAMMTINIIGHIKLAKERGVHVTMYVDGDVYSAHAFLATQGDDLFLHSKATMYFHTTSSFEEDCKSATGMDRADSAYAVCKLVVDSWLMKSNRMIDDIKFLTKEAKDRIKTGHGVIVFWNDSGILSWETTDDSLKEIKEKIKEKGK